MSTLFQSFWTISQQVQVLQTRAEQEDITQKTRFQLHRQLESLQGSIEALREDAEQIQNYIHAQFDELEIQIISLYRIVEEGFEQFQMQQISKKALELTIALQSGSILGIAKKTRVLRQNILFLFEHRSPSMNNRKILQLATKITEEASHMLTCKNTEHEHIQFILILKSLLKEALSRAQNTICLDEATLSIEFYEIADLLYQKQNNEAKLRLKLMSSRLSEEQRKKIESAKNEYDLAQILLDLSGTEDRAISYEMFTVQGV